MDNQKLEPMFKQTFQTIENGEKIVTTLLWVTKTTKGGKPDDESGLTIRGID